MPRYRHHFACRLGFHSNRQSGLPQNPSVTSLLVSEALGEDPKTLSECAVTVTMNLKGLKCVTTSDSGNQKSLFMRTYHNSVRFRSICARRAPSTKTESKRNLETAPVTSRVDIYPWQRGRR